MKRAITVYIRGKANPAFYYPQLMASYHQPGDPDEIELKDNPNLCPERHRLLYVDLLNQARVLLYGYEGD